MPLHVRAHTPFRGPWACRREGGRAVQSPSVPTAPRHQPPGGAGPGSWGGEQELSLEPTPAFSVGAWKPLEAGVAPALPLRDRLGIPGRTGPPPPCQAPCQAWQLPECQRECGSAPPPPSQFRGCRTGPADRSPALSTPSSPPPVPHSQHSSGGAAWAACRAGTRVSCLLPLPRRLSHCFSFPRASPCGAGPGKWGEEECACPCVCSCVCACLRGEYVSLHVPVYPSLWACICLQVCL